MGASRFGEYDKLQPQTTSEQCSIGDVRALLPARVHGESLKSKDYEVASRESRRPKGSVWIGIPRGEEEERDDRIGNKSGIHNTSWTTTFSYLLVS